MRIRTIKPEFWSHPIMARLPADTQLLAIALLCHSDDEGYFMADPAIVRGNCMPYTDSIPKIAGCVQKLSEVGWIEVSEHSEYGKIGRVREWEKHQRLDHPKPSKIKSYWNPENCGIHPEKNTQEQGTGNREQGTGNRDAQTTAPVIPDSLKFASAEIEAYFAHRIEIKKPLKPTGISMLISRLNAATSSGIDVRACLRESVSNGWQGVFLEKSPVKRGPESADEASERISRELRQARGEK